MRAMLISGADGSHEASFVDVREEELPPHGVLIDVHYSSLNYKDGLAITRKSKIARRHPMVGGIDLAGIVLSSDSSDWQPGDSVVVNGWGLSEVHWGGFCERARVKPEWITRLPEGIDLRRAMAIGTAGYTAMLCVQELQNAGITPGSREVLVTGAGGGVGSVAVAILSHLGYAVAASTGRSEIHDYLTRLGASRVVQRAALLQLAGPLQREEWAGAVDSVGGPTLANALSQTAYGGAVAACGLASGSELPGSVLPFILRGVSLRGVDSVMAPPSKREMAWNRLARDLPMDKLDQITTVEPWTRLPELAEEIVRGQIRGRVVLDIKGNG